MDAVAHRYTLVWKHPGEFALRVVQAFRANQGLLLAGAVAYYTLLSIVPLLILMVIALSHLVDQAELMQTLHRALEWVMPGQGKAVEQELAAFLDHRAAIGVPLLVTPDVTGTQANGTPNRDLTRTMKS